MFYICSNCEYGSGSWIGKCPQCGEWNTFAQKKEEKTPSLKGTEKLEIFPLSGIQPINKERIKTGIYEFDRVLGGGFVPGEALLLTGEPGIGKSTLLLQALQHLQTLYFSGEESAEQITERARRLKISPKNFLFSNTLQAEGIVHGVSSLDKKPAIIVVDSVQTVYSKTVEAPPGSISQLKESTTQLISLAKKLKIPIILIGHVTKEGGVAGPKTLEHFVDCVISFEGERISNYRILRASKNRFGSIDELGIFEMNQMGLQEVSNPLIFLDQETDLIPGKAIAGIVEGKRSLFFEIQTLTVPTILAIPRRVVKGVHYNKVLLLLAVIRKQLGVSLDTFDIYVNVVGGVNIESTAADLAVVASLLSSIKNIPIPKHAVFSGEVGLLGEVRSFFEDKIIQESKRLKFTHIYSQKTVKSIKELSKHLIR